MNGIAPCAVLVNCAVRDVGRGSSYCANCVVIQFRGAGLWLVPPVAERLSGRAVGGVGVLGGADRHRLVGAQLPLVNVRLVGLALRSVSPLVARADHRAGEAGWALSLTEKLLLEPSSTAGSAVGETVSDMLGACSRRDLMLIAQICKSNH